MYKHSRARCLNKYTYLNGIDKEDLAGVTQSDERHLGGVQLLVMNRHGGEALPEQLRLRIYASTCC